MTEEKIDWTVDRTEFPRGPWDEEPDYFFFRHEGTPCLVVRNSVLGHLCGYAGVYPDHELFGKNYMDLYDGDGTYPEVHGGLTYSDKCHPPVCHVPDPGEQEVWWFGFDCAHAGDFSPKGYDVLGDYLYRDFEYVKGHCRALADWLTSQKEEN